MDVTVKEFFEKTRHIKNNDKSKKYILRGQRNIKYHERILSIKKKSNLFVNFLEEYNRYNAEIINVNITFDDLSNDISHVVIAGNFIFCTCLRYVDISSFNQFSRRL